MELKLDTSKVYAIALEGGGARGAYQVGVWRALEEAGIRYNAVSGTSVGAINGALMAMRDLNQAENFMTMPDFIAYRFSDRKTFSNILTQKFWKLQGVSWTLKSQEELDEAVAEGWLPIFEGFKP